MPEVSNNLVPIVAAGDDVLIWAKDGDLNARGMAPALRRKAVADVVSPAQDGNRIPLIAAGRKVVLWLQNGVLRGPGLNDRRDETVPLHSDGRTLFRVRQKIAQVKTGVTGAKVRVALSGDSWSEMTEIATALRNMMESRIGAIAEGWQPLKNDFPMGGVTFDRSSGWTIFDASVNSNWPYGVGVDGHNLHTTGNAETATVHDIPATDIRIYSFQYGGTWRYRVDGGPWETVAEDASGGIRITTISGLPDASHTLEIDTSGNAGVVSLAGFYSTRSAASTEVLKMGNSGLTGYRLRDFAPLIGEQLADMQPDLLIVNLGTNDYRNGYSTVQAYTDGLVALASTARAAVPDVGIVFVVPPQSNDTAVTPLGLYRDAAYFCSRSLGCEFLNLFDQFGPYAQSSARGQWFDSWHLSAAGADCYARILNHTFLGL